MRGAARRLGEQGVAAYRNADYASALDKLTRADELVRAPSLSLWAARTLVKLGRLVEANERYLEATRRPIDEAELGPARSAVQRQAQTDAAQERAELKPRIPVLTISVSGAAPDELRVTLDGVDVPSALLGVGQPVDPGAHELVAAHAGKEQRRQVTLEERSTQQVEFNFDGGAGDRAEPAVAGRSPESAAPLRPPAQPAGMSIPEDQGAGGSRFVPAYIAFGVGGAGLIFGGVTGALAILKQGELDDDCPDKRCPPPAHGVVDDYDGMRTLSTVGFAIGLVGGAAGLVLVLTAPQEPRLTARVTPGGLSFGGQF